jgi:zinc transporter ZupT
VDGVLRGRVAAPGWLAALLPLVLLGAAIAVFVALDAPGLERNGVPVEDVAIERTELHPGAIELHLVNDGPDPVRIAQTIVNDGFAPFEQDDAELGRLDRSVVTIDYPWIEGEAYEIVLLSATGNTFSKSIGVAAETPAADTGFYGLMALIGLYVGIIPVGIGMLWLPWMRRLDRRRLQFLLALTIGLLVFLGIDAALEGLDLGAAGADSLGGGALVWLGAIVAYAALAGVDAWLGRRRAGSAPPAAGAPATGAPAAGESAAAARGGERVALLVAIGIGLHNLGEGLAIGSAYAVGSLALGAALVVGFALHNTTEGLAIVAPIAAGRPRLRRLLLLGLIAGAPAIAGAWIGASAFDPSLAALMFGLGVGAIARVIVQISPQVRDASGRLLHPLAVGGLVAGLALMYATGLLISL